MTKDISILDLQALLEVFAEYDEFEKDLTKLLSEKNSMQHLYKIRELANGEKVLCSRNIKNFYKKHENIIKKIHGIVNIQSFIYHSFDWDKQTNIYKYLDAHRDELDKIKEVVLKLKELGFDKIEFDETFDFTTKKYYMWTWMADNTSIHYLSDIEAIPGYESDRIVYQTNSSPFELKIGTSFAELSKRYNRAKLNSLTFDKDLLPSEITKAEIIKPIQQAKQEKIKEYDAIGHIVDLRQVEQILESKLKKLEAILKNVDRLSNKESVLKSLRTIKVELENIKQEISSYEDVIVDESTYITPDILDKEEEAYERRKRDSEIHIW